MSLPTLDFSKYLHGSPDEKLKVAVDLVQSFKDSGFVKLINHGLPEESVRNYLDMSTKYFKLPRATKETMANPRGPWPQRGWSCVGAEQTAGLRKENLQDDSAEGMEDSKEHVDIGPSDDVEYPNRWLKEEELPGFRNLMTDGFDLLQHKSLEIIGAMELGLGLHPGTFADRCKPDTSEFRILYYPQISLKTLRESKVKRAWPHTDFGIITLLFQDSVGGLELEDRRNPTEFLPVLPAPSGAPSEMVVNISDMMQRWTNDIIKAGVHQVSVPPSIKSNEFERADSPIEGVIPVRHSCVFFFKPHRETSAGPLPEFVTKDNPAIHDEITALDYQKRRTQILYSGGGAY